MKPRHKLYLKLNIMSIVFVVVSFISVTLAWFAYSGLADASMEVNVKAWYIELSKDGQTVSNEIVISLEDIYPGMNTINEKVKIANKGDSIAQVKYAIKEARLLDINDYVIDDLTTSPYVEDLLSHTYPFHININLSKGYTLNGGDESEFEVSISWPLDSDNDAQDSYWGVEAYKFDQSEASKKASNPDYQIRPAINVVISITAEQYIEEDTTSDYNYNLGDHILYDVVSNSTCALASSTCLDTRIIDVDSKLGDPNITLLPDITSTFETSTYSNYQTVFDSYTSTWTANKRGLKVEDLLKIISTDVNNSLLIRNTLSPSIIGNLKYDTRMTTELNKAITYNGNYTFLNDKFSYLVKSSCYWLNNEYNTTNGFAVNQIDVTNSKIYGELKTTECSVIPVIIVPKSSL